MEDRLPPPLESPRAPTALSPGMRFGPYEVLSTLGAGGVGQVYRAKDTRLGREVAIKVLPGQLSSVQECLDCFENEAVQHRRSTTPISSPSTNSARSIRRTTWPWSWSRERRCGNSLPPDLSQSKRPFKLQRRSPMVWRRHMKRVSPTGT